MLNGLIVTAVIVGGFFAEYKPFVKCVRCTSRKTHLVLSLSWSRRTKTPVPVTVINRRCWSCGHHEHIGGHHHGEYFS